tara:strand:+ start:29659 stop:29769 length:111 start_codon:yes stop_codon:yes gene_type:complete
MTIFFSVIAILIAINFLLLQFSCNEVTDPEAEEEEE